MKFTIYNLQFTNTKENDLESGQALVTLLIFLMMALAIGTAASFIIAANSQATTNIQEGLIGRQMADSGVEIAYLKILRNNYTYTGETINVGSGSVVVAVTWNGTRAAIESTATNGNFVKKVESIVTYDNNGLTQISWKEIN